MDLLFFILNIVLLITALTILIYLSIKKFSFSLQSFVALILGICIGIFIYYTQTGHLENKTLGFYSLEVYRVIAEIFINLLRAMVYPLIVVAILTALTRIESIKELGKYGISIIAILLAGVAIASFISIAVMYLFGLTKGLTLPVNTINNLASYSDKAPTNFADIIINFFPVNPFLDLTGARRSSTIATVIFVAIVGIAYLSARKQYPEETAFFKKIIDSLYIVIMKALSIIIRLTPYGILALIVKVIATTNLDSILSLANFVICTLVAIALMFVAQTVLIMLFGFNPLIYYKKTFPLLTFSFFSRSSAASIPLGINIQTSKLGINQSIANLSTSLGATIGQAGCVGVYVTMVIFMTAAAIGQNPWNLSFMLFTVFIVVITSFGIGGIGGGAIYGALVGLAAFNYPVAMLGLLIPIEAIIDMFRTASNVNGLTVSGLLTSKITASNDKSIYNSKEIKS